MRLEQLRLLLEDTKVGHHLQMLFVGSLEWHRGDDSHQRDSEDQEANSLHHDVLSLVRLPRRAPTDAPKDKSACPYFRRGNPLWLPRDSGDHGGRNYLDVMTKCARRFFAHADSA